MVVLAHDIHENAAATRTAAFLHGILGSKNNWKSFCKRLVAEVPTVRCAVVDLRGHGRSVGFAPPHTIAACADDVLALGLLPAVVVGHSFGGKVALDIARRRPPGLEHVVVLDVPPGPRVFTGDSEVERVLGAVRNTPMPIASRRALIDSLRARGLSEPVALWMTTNLVPVDGMLGEAPHSEGPLRWAFELDVIDALLGSFGAADFWPFLEAHEGAPHVHIVRAGRGGRFTPPDLARLEALVAAGRVGAHVMKDAGHWLHTDDPAGLAAVLQPILRAEAA